MRNNTSPFPMYSFPNTAEGKARITAMLDAFTHLLDERFSGPGYEDFKDGIRYAIQYLCPHPVEHWIENGGEEPYYTYACGVCGALGVEEKG